MTMTKISGGNLAIAAVAALLVFGSLPASADSIPVSRDVGFDTVALNADVFALRSHEKVASDAYWSPDGSPYIGEPRRGLKQVHWTGFVPRSDVKAIEFGTVGNISGEKLDLFDPDSAIVLSAENISDGISKTNAPRRSLFGGFALPNFDAVEWNTAPDNLINPSHSSGPATRIKVVSEICPVNPTKAKNVRFECRMASEPAATILRVVDFIINTIRTIFGSGASQTA